MCYSKLFPHTLSSLKTSMDVIKIIMEDMEEMFQNPNTPLADAKILNIARDISFYKIFNFNNIIETAIFDFNRFLP